MTEKILALEWKNFDRVQNLGGRAACQDDPDTFRIMRSSQLLAWNAAMRESYYADLAEAGAEGRNLLAEKYAYMMERTNPEEFANFRARLPACEPEKAALIDRISALHVAWQEALAEAYPCLAGRSRPIRKEEDGPCCTSFETYLQGELKTYSLKTLRLYLDYASALLAEGKNLNEMVLANTAAQYGYASTDAAEAAAARRSGRAVR